MVTALDTQTLMNGVVNVMTVSIFAQALGALMAATELAQPPGKARATELGLASLREMFGAETVSKALKRIPDKTDIVSVARATEATVLEELYSQYSEFEVNTAMSSCPAGDFRCVKEVASALHSRGVTPVTQPAVAQKVASGTASRFQKMKRAAVKIKDLKTGRVYDSIAAMGRDLAPTYGIDPNISFVGYAVMSKDPTRFTRM